MSFGRIIGGLLQKKLGGRGGDRLRAGAGQSGAGGDRMLESLLSQGGGGGRGLAGAAQEFLRGKQAGGLSGAQVGGLGALAGAIFGGGLGGAARGGAMAVLGTLALKAWREHQAAAGAPAPDEATPEEAEALTSPEAERLALSAMIGAAQADGRIDEAEMDRLLDSLGEDATEAERAELRAEAAKPVDVEALAGKVSRPEVATEIYLAALTAVEVDSEDEKAYLRRLAGALKLEPGVVTRLHRMTGAPMP